MDICVKDMEIQYCMCGNVERLASVNDAGLRVGSSSRRGGGAERMVLPAVPAISSHPPPPPPLMCPRWSGVDAVRRTNNGGR